MAESHAIDKTAAPICCHLRSQGMYVHGTTDEVETAVPGSGSGYFWCLKTMHLFGPDNEIVNREVCKPSRHCYETI